MPELHPEQVRLAARLADVLGHATVPVTLAEEVHAAVAGLRALYDAAACSFAQAEHGGESLRFVAADGAGAADIIGVVLPVGRGIAGWVAMSGDAIKISDVTTDTRFARDVAEATNYVPTTILAAPVIDARGETVGVLEVLDPQSGGDSGHDLRVLELAATWLAAIVRLVGLYERLGTGLIRTLVDEPDGDWFEGAIGPADDRDGVVLQDLAEAFRTLAAAGPQAAQVATRILRDVADLSGGRR